MATFNINYEHHHNVHTIFGKKMSIIIDTDIYIYSRDTGPSVAAIFNALPIDSFINVHD